LEADKKAAFERIGASFLVRQAVVTMATVTNELVLPKDMAKVAPRLYNLFQAAAAAAGMTVVPTGPLMGVIKNSDVWSVDDGVAQTHLDSIDSESQKTERRNLESVLDFFESMGKTVDYPIINPSLGLYRAAAIYVEVHRQVIHGTPRSVTVESLRRQKDKGLFLAQMRSQFMSFGTAQLLCDLGGIMLSRLYAEVCRSEPPVYETRLVEALRPSSTRLADAFYRKESELQETERSKANPSTKKENREYARVPVSKPPTVQCNSKELNELGTPAELIILKEINRAVVAQKGADTYNDCYSKELEVHADNVRRKVGALYAVQDAIFNFYKVRRETVKDMVLGKAKEMITAKLATDLSATMRKIWPDYSVPYMKTVKDNSLEEFLLSIHFWRANGDKDAKACVAAWVKAHLSHNT
jgi:hypothetical protein